MDQLGRYDPASSLGLADSKASDARLPAPRRIGDGRWPRISIVLRVFALVAVAVIIAGWILTALTA